MRALNSMLAALAFTVALPALSETTPHEYCMDQSKAAGELMKARQGGVLLHDLMDALKGEKEKTILLMVHEAYRRPLANGDDAKEAAVTEFQNEMYAACIKAAK